MSSPRHAVQELAVRNRFLQKQDLPRFTHPALCRLVVDSEVITRRVLPYTPRSPQPLTFDRTIRTLRRALDRFVM
jgi:hypothetical protein